MIKPLILTILLIGLLALSALRLRDGWVLSKLWADLSARPAVALAFDHAMLKGLPEPAQRFFRFAIAEGTPLLTTVELSMRGELDLASKDAPKPQTMIAQQILSAPHGFIWKPKLPGFVPVSGSDGFAGDVSWSRFRLFNVIPVARAGGTQDHLLSSFGRMVGEAVFWTPATMLPATKAGWDSLEWEGVSADTAAVTVRLGALETRAELTVDAEGRPLNVVFARWSNANASQQFALQPFGGDFTEWGEFEGYRLPIKITAGNHYGTALYHPFYQATIEAIRFPQSPR